MPLPRSAPEQQGIPRAAIDAFFAAAGTIRDLHSTMVLRHGHVVAEAWWAPYSPERPHMLFSISKSFAATAIGLLQAEGALTVDDLVLPYFTKEAPTAPGEHLQALRIKHLLMMATGHDTDTIAALFTAPGQSWSTTILAQPIVHAPGSHFVYNSGATYLLSVIAQRVSGQTLLDYLRPRLLTPLGISGGTWESCPEGYNIGGWGLNLTTEDIARFGQLYLQRGQWQGEQLIPAEWVAAASANQIANNGDGVDWQQGYGYQFWRSQHNGYRGEGLFGQFCVMLPDNDAVIVFTSAVSNTQDVLDVVWQHLIPAFGERHEANAPGSYKPSPALALPVGDAQSAQAPFVSGRAYSIDANARGISEVTLTCTPTGGTLRIVEPHAVHDIPFGHGTTVLGKTQLNTRDGVPQAIASAGAWQDAHTHVTKVFFLHGPFCLTITNRFEGDTVATQAQLNLTAFGDLGYSLTGRAA